MKSILLKPGAFEIMIEAELSFAMIMSGFSVFLPVNLIIGATNKKAIEAIAMVLRIKRERVNVELDSEGLYKIIE